MNAARPVPAAAPAAEAQVCRPVRPRPLPGVSGKLLRYAPLFRDVPRETLMAELRDAPQFEKLQLRPLLEDTRGSLRVLLLAEDGYYAVQAAVYAASLSRSRESPPPRRETGGFWEGVDFSELEDPDEESAGALLRRSLAVLSPQALDPALRRGRSKGTLAVAGKEEGPTLSLRSLDAPAALIAAPSGLVLTSGVLEQVESLALRDADKPLDLFIALRESQMDLELVEELRFTHGFQAVRVGRPDQAYLCRFLRSCGEDFLAPIDGLADLDRVVAHTRRLRGDRFSELDLESLVLWAIQRHTPTPLQTEDLLFTPLKSQGEAWEELERMTGLEEVKGTLRRQAGKTVRPMCRNLAFAGPPGTGKSAAARLAARILREEGCGSGRFVEAGREQLIGTYLGETSPKVAELFDQARGGMLFIDEAGALLDGGQDTYAVEAVNALVRHMELQPETMVILATYPGEMERLLSSNPGLRSRMAQVLDFPAYDDAQLWEIFQGFAREADCPLPQGAGAVCREFFSALRRRDPQSFGNGREARRLFQRAVEELALRTLDTGEAPLSLEDLKAASARLLAGGGGESRAIGFR